MAINRGQFGIAEQDIISTIERVTAEADRSGSPNYVNAWICDHWILVAAASKSAAMGGWELVTPEGMTYLAPVNLVAFQFGSWV